MTISTISESLEMVLFSEVPHLVKENIPGMPGFELRGVYEPEMPHHICCIKYNNKP